VNRSGLALRQNAELKKQNEDDTANILEQAHFMQRDLLGSAPLMHRAMIALWVKDQSPITRGRFRKRWQPL